MNCFFFNANVNSKTCGTGNIEANELDFDDVNVNAVGEITDSNDLDFDTDSVNNELRSIEVGDLQSKSRPTFRSSVRPQSRPNSRESSNASFFGGSQEV